MIFAPKYVCTPAMLLYIKSKPKDACISWCETRNVNSPLSHIEHTKRGKKIAHNNFFFLKGNVVILKRPLLFSFHCTKEVYSF